MWHAWVDQDRRIRGFGLGLIGYFLQIGGQKRAGLAALVEANSKGTYSIELSGWWGDASDPLSPPLHSSPALRNQI